MCGFVDKMTNMVKLMRCTNLCLTVYFSRILSGQDTFVYYFRSLHSFCPIFLNENFHTKEDPNSWSMWGTNFAYYMFSCLKVGIFYEKSSFFFSFFKDSGKGERRFKFGPKNQYNAKVGLMCSDNLIWNFFHGDLTVLWSDRNDRRVHGKKLNPESLINMGRCSQVECLEVRKNS